MKKITQFMIAGSAAALLTACGTSDTETANQTDAPVVQDVTPTDSSDVMVETNIVEVAQGNPDFSTLVSAIKAADLVETLSGPGPYTVFAPNNAAFDKVGADTLQTLMKPENKAKLAAILKYHVVSGKMTAADITKAINDGGGKAELTTVEGEKLQAMMDGSNVKLTDASGNTSSVILADLAAKNGVIHAIDTVLMPKSPA